MKHCIVYGTSNGAKALEEASRNEWNIDCFVEEDPEKFGINGLILDGRSFSVLSLRGAMEKYSDADWFLNVPEQEWAKVIEQLRTQGKVDPHQIHATGKDKEWRLGCSIFGRTIIFASEVARCCVDPYNHQSDLPWNADTDFGRAVEWYQESTQEILRDWRKGDESKCVGCPQLRWDIWSREPQLEEINISSTTNGDWCNAKCIYCPKFPKPDEEIYQRRGREMIQVIDDAHARWPGKKMRVVASGGDISVAPFRKKLFDRLKKYQWTAHIYSNSAIFVPEICEQLKDGVSLYFTTLDSTLREKWAEIKGIDALPQALESIRKYAAAARNPRQQIRIKMIVLDGVYHAFEEIKGIVDFTEEIGATLQLSCNQQNIKTPMSAHMADLVRQWIRYAKGKQLPLNVQYEHFHQEDGKWLREFMAALSKTASPIPVPRKRTSGNIPEKEVCIDSELLHRLQSETYSFALGEDIYRRFRFPFDAVTPGSRIVIYGGGVVGKTFLRQIARSSYCTVAAICDKNPGNTGIKEVPVISVPQLSGMPKDAYDLVVIAIEKKEIAKEIRGDLIMARIPEEKICWIDPRVNA